MLIPGHATPEGTARFRDRFAPGLPGHFREGQGLWLSSIGLGTYLGEPTAACDVLYREAVEQAVGKGINVIDSAVNYRHQRSERSIGAALAASIAEGKVQRDEILIATKGGFLSFDSEEPTDPAAYFEAQLIETGLVRMDEVVAGCHVMSPKYLERQIEVSRQNLGVETLDLYYVHNPETQLSQVSRDEFHRRLKASFAALEKAVGEGKIRMYGVATWNAFRVGQDARDAVALADVFRLAEEVGGKDHHLRAIQLPFNLAMPEALAANTQRLDGRAVPVLQVARAFGLLVFSSASLLQGRLTDGLPQDVRRGMPNLKTDAQRALQFVRSTPGITCALVGMSRSKHVDENLGAAAVPPLCLDEFRALFKK